MEKKITIRVTDQEYAKLVRQAEENRISVAALCKVRTISGNAGILENRRAARSAIQIRRLLSQCSLDSEIRNELEKELDCLCHIWS